jgi:UPF0716 protein FxsA
MPLARLIVISVLLLPAAEIAAFVLVASAIGTGRALLLLLLTCLLGVVVLRHAGLAKLARLRVVAEGGRRTLKLNLSDFATVIGGALLVIPGFITDAIGLGLLVVPARWFEATIAQMGPGGRAEPDPVVDLDPAEWRQVERAEPKDGNPALTERR